MLLSKLIVFKGMKSIVPIKNEVQVILLVVSFNINGQSECQKHI
jgi:hypothetical protein